MPLRAETQPKTILNTPAQWMLIVTYERHRRGKMNGEEGSPLIPHFEEWARSRGLSKSCALYFRLERSRRSNIMLQDEVTQAAWEGFKAGIITVMWAHEKGVNPRVA